MLRAITPGMAIGEETEHIKNRINIEKKEIFRLSFVFVMPFSPNRRSPRLVNGSMRRVALEMFVLRFLRFTHGPARAASV